MAQGDVAFGVVPDGEGQLVAPVGAAGGCCRTGSGETADEAIGR